MARRIVGVARCPECGSASVAPRGEGCGWCRAAAQLAAFDAELSAFGAAMPTMMAVMARAVTRQAELMTAALLSAIEASSSAYRVRAELGDPTGDGPLPR